MEINFYQCDEQISRSIAPLMLKVIEEKKKVLILVSNQSQMKEIDDVLWSYGKNKFIPHITVYDKDFDFKRQPIVISDKEENANDAEYLVLIKDVSENFLSNFSRIFYFYDQLNIDEAKVLMPKYKKVAAKFEAFKKQDGKWIKGV
ncbi:MAG: DNA polymerase III subunit chi [Pelagibacterales bacterium]|nr:DNA polymerase III subunit chi [Pelagibacterales bacterium]